MSTITVSVASTMSCPPAARWTMPVASSSNIVAVASSRSGFCNTSRRSSAVASRSSGLTLPAGIGTRGHPLSELGVLTDQLGGGEGLSLCDAQALSDCVGDPLVAWRIDARHPDPARFQVHHRVPVRLGHSDLPYLSIRSALVIASASSTWAPLATAQPIQSAFGAFAAGLLATTTPWSGSWLADSSGV